MKHTKSLILLLYWAAIESNWRHACVIDDAAICLLSTHTMCSNLRISPVNTTPVFNSIVVVVSKVRKDCWSYVLDMEYMFHTEYQAVPTSSVQPSSRTPSSITNCYNSERSFLRPCRTFFPTMISIRICERTRNNNSKRFDCFKTT